MTLADQVMILVPYDFQTSVKVKAPLHAGLATTAAGKGILETWGYDQTDVQETLQELHLLLQDSDASSDFSNA